MSKEKPKKLCNLCNCVYTLWTKKYYQFGNEWYSQELHRISQGRSDSNISDVKPTRSKYVLVKLRNRTTTVRRGEEGQPQKFLVRATFSSFSCPSHLEILVLRLLCVLMFPFHGDNFFLNLEKLKYCNDVGIVKSIWMMSNFI